jgi:sialic acid synthase SpsE
LFDTEYDKDLVSKGLIQTRMKFGRGLSLKKDIKKGEIVLEDVFTLKKPQGPLDWSDRFDLIGKRAVRNLSSAQHLNKSDFEW